MTGISDPMDSNMFSKVAGKPKKSKKMSMPDPPYEPEEKSLESQVQDLKWRVEDLEKTLASLKEDFEWGRKYHSHD